MAQSSKETKGPRVRVFKTHGAVRQGIVVSTKTPKTAVIEIHYLRRVPKFERIEKRKSKLHAHVPSTIKVNTGDLVEVEECRKISKTKAHIVTKIITHAE